MTSATLTLHNPAIARGYYERGLWQNETLYMMLSRHAVDRPDAFALQDSRHRLTWSQLKSWADGVAADLFYSGIAPGHRIAVWLPSRVETIVTFLASSRNGYIAVLSLHQNHTVREVMTLLERCGTKAFVGQPGYGADSDSKISFDSLVIFLASNALTY